MLIKMINRIIDYAPCLSRYKEACACRVGSTLFDIQIKKVNESQYMSETFYKKLFAIPEVAQLFIDESNEKHLDGMDRCYSESVYFD